MVHHSAGDHCSAFSYYARDFTFFNKQEREGTIYFFVDNTKNGTRQLIDLLFEKNKETSTTGGLSFVLSHFRFSISLLR